MHPLTKLARTVFTWKGKLTADLDVGRYSYLNVGCSVRGDVTIGDFCAIGRDVTLQARNHITNRTSQQRILYDEVLDEPVGFREEPIEIGHDVWLCNGATVLPGVEIGTGAIVAAESVVTADVDPYAVVAGQPAERVTWRFPEEVREQLLASEWWTWDESRLQERAELLRREWPNRIPEQDVTPEPPADRRAVADGGDQA